MRRRWRDDSNIHPPVAARRAMSTHLKIARRGPAESNFIRRVAARTAMSTVMKARPDLGIRVSSTTLYESRQVCNLGCGSRGIGSGSSSRSGPTGARRVAPAGGSERRASVGFLIHGLIRPVENRRWPSPSTAPSLFTHFRGLNWARFLLCAG